MKENIFNKKPLMKLVIFPTGKEYECEKCQFISNIGGTCPICEVKEIKE